MIGPSHYAIYGALHRRKMWLDQLGGVFAPFGSADFKSLKARLDASFARTLKRLSIADELGVQSALPLERIVDDTPIESFLDTLSDELDAYECNLFDLMRRSGSRLGWETELEEVSLLWGRQIAQELRVSLAGAGALEAGPTRSIQSLGVTLSQLFSRPLLFRRRTPSDVRYELRLCPHRRPAASAESADLACRLESLVYRAFAQALFEDVRFRRVTNPEYCVDELLLGEG